MHPYIRKVLQKLTFGRIFDVVEDAGAEETASSNSPHPFDIAFIRQVDGLELSDGGNDNSNLSSPFRKIPS